MIEEIQKIYNSKIIELEEFISTDVTQKYRCEELVNDFKMKYAICKVIKPQSILEIGLNSEYNALAFLQAAENAKYTGIENEFPTFVNSGDPIKWREKITIRYNASFLTGNTRQMTKLPGDFYDLIYIDGQRDGDTTYHELGLAFEKGRWILLGNYFRFTEDMLSATYFLKKYNNFIEFSLIIPSYTGELLIKTKPSAKDIFSELDLAHYSGLQNTYDREYFMRDCGGFDSFKRNHGQKLEDPRLIAAYCLANPRPNKKILDVGCGRGELAFALASAGADVLGIDYSQAAIDIAKSTFLSKQERLNLDYIQADFLIWPSSDRFDVILATDLIEHIENEPLQRVMKKISGLLKPKGVAIFHTAPNKHYYDKYYPQLRMKAREAGSYLLENPRSYYEDLMHINEQTPEGLDLLLRKNFNNYVVWVAKDHEMVGSLDKKYPPELLYEARGIFAVASNCPVIREDLIALLSQQPLERKESKVRLQVKRSTFSARVNEHFALTVQIKNEGNTRLASVPPHPIHISYHWLDKGGNVAVFDGIRTQIMPPLNGHDSREFTVDIVAPLHGGEYLLQLTLVQESLFWFEEIMPDLPVSLKFLIKPA